MKKMIGLLACILLLFGFASAEQTVQLPQSRYAVDVPDGMKYSAPAKDDRGVQAYVSRTLEMDYFSYTREEAGRAGFQPTLQETAEKLAAAGAEAELRDVNGIEMLVYRVEDDSDGAQGIGYAFADGDRIVEVVFWYATQEAADMSKQIMETIRMIQD